jgi:hypothetical protein
MTRSIVLTCAVAVVGLAADADVAEAAQKHFPAHHKVDLKKDGKHELHPIKNHATHAHVKNGKVSHVTVAHNKNGNVKGRKVKTGKRVVSADRENETHYVSGDLDDYQIGVTIYVGWAFYVDGHYYVFWFPVAYVDGGDSGCIDVDDLSN